MKLASRLPALLLLSVGACSRPTGRPELAAPMPAFSPFAFFSGKTIGDGVLRIALSPARQVQVVGEGHVDAAGILVLVQRVEESGSPPRTRTWHLQALAHDCFVGTLSDARGPVRAEVRGNVLHVRFTTTGALGVEQWLYLQPDGQTALNHMAVRKFGIRIAVLHETIRRSQ